MKTKIATAISLIGVLAAGSAAAMVNTEILDDESAAAGTSAEVLIPDPAPEVGRPGEPKVIVVPAPEPPSNTTESIGSVAATSSASGSSAAPSALTEFTVGLSGTVSVDVVDGQLVIVDAQPNAGWTLTKSEAGADQIEVYFATETVQVEFTARLVDGQIIPNVDSTWIGGSPSGSSPTTPPNGDSDDSDDDHDDHDEDDFDEVDEVDDDEFEVDDHEEEEPDDD